MNTLRAGILLSAVPPAQLIGFFGRAAQTLIESLDLMNAVDSDTPQGQQVLAVDGVMRANEGFALILAALAAPNRADILPVYVGGLSALQPAGVRMTQHFSQEQTVLYQTVIATFDAQLGPNFASRLLANPGTALANLKTPPSFRDIVALTGAGRMVESKVMSDALAEAEQSAFSDNAKAAGFLGFSVLTVVLAGLLGIAVGRSVAVPLLRLTRSADRVARLAEAELVRVADDESPTRPTDPPASRSTSARRDEIGDLARAFEPGAGAPRPGWSSGRWPAGATSRRCSATSAGVRRTWSAARSR